MMGRGSSLIKSDWATPARVSKKIAKFNAGESGKREKLGRIERKKRAKIS